MNLVALPAFQDNYIWLLHDGRAALVVDPGDAQVVQSALAAHRLQLRAILVTHHHPDHTGGVAALRDATDATVYGPAGERIPEPFTPVRDGEVMHAIGLPWQVMEVPGHTAGHIAFYGAAVSGAPVLFCGDTLFSAGCGRLFEGTPAQMLASLDRLAALPADTRVCCAHEYTLSNLRFALAVEPDNADLQRYHADCVSLRERGLPTLPARMDTERRINPFLRTREAAVLRAVRQREPAAADEAAVFGALREWKNQFR